MKPLQKKHLRRSTSPEKNAWEFNIDIECAVLLYNEYSSCFHSISDWTEENVFIYKLKKIKQLKNEIWSHP